MNSVVTDGGGLAPLVNEIRYCFQDVVCFSKVSDLGFLCFDPGDFFTGRSGPVDDVNLGLANPATLGFLITK